MRLEVLLAGRLIGWLGYESATHRYVFDYAPSWIDCEEAFALSPDLPLIRPDAIPTPEQHSAIVRQFFENLLPEGQALDDAAAAYAVSKSNLVGLLAALGRETSGALSLSVAATPPTGASRRRLPPEELSQRIRQRPQRAFSVWDGKVRLSIAGFQDKIAVLTENEQWFLVEGAELASTHILKPEPIQPLLAGLTSNEFFCMRLAERVKLPVAEVRLYHITEPVLQITRFDRQMDGATVRRLHTIDGCQALGLPPSFKYERPYGNARNVRNMRELRDGASLPRLFRLLADSARPAAEQRALLRWTIFQILIGNTDAHAKNISFMAGATGLALAKAYDLVCGLAFSGDNLDRSYAMAIGDAFSPHEVSAYEWATLSIEAGLNPTQVKKELALLAQTARRALPATIEASCGEGADRAIVSRIAALIETECERQQAMAAAIPALAKDLLRS